MNDTSERVFRFIVDFKRSHDGNSPTVREVAAGLKMGTTTVAYHLRLLERGGVIRSMGFGFSRGVLVVGGRWKLER